MALTLQQQVDIADDGNFQKRVVMAMLAVARDQLDSDDDNPLRTSFATAMILNSWTENVRYVSTVVSDYGIVESDYTEPDEIPDVLIVQAVQYLWDYLSGASSNGPFQNPPLIKPQEQTPAPLFFE